MRRIRYQKRPSLTRTLLVGGVEGLIEFGEKDMGGQVNCGYTISGLFQLKLSSTR